MKVCEIFTSIQGESTLAGILTTFIRFSGCNLRCTYCDTTYSYEGGMEMSEDDIVNEVTLVGVRHICVTGGEPLMQDGVIQLIERLISEGHEVLIETNGSMSIKDVDPRAKIVLDIKTPSSRMNGEMDLMNLDFLKPSDEVKFVVVDRSDYEWVQDFVGSHPALKSCNKLISPAFGFMEPRLLVDWLLQDRFDIRLNLQLHKYLFGEEKEGSRLL